MVWVDRSGPRQRRVYKYQRELCNQNAAYAHCPSLIQYMSVVYAAMRVAPGFAEPMNACMSIAIATFLILHDDTTAASNMLLLAFLLGAGI